MDEQNRKLTAMGRWAEGWKVGDIVDAVVEERKWTDRDGFEQTGLSLKNPTPSTFKGYQKNTLVDAYHIAAALAPIIYNGKKIKMVKIDKLAEYINNKLEVTAPQNNTAAPAAVDPVPAVDVNETKSPAAEPSTTVEDNELEIEDADDDKPF